jgi:hypothetical protein
VDEGRDEGWWEGREGEKKGVHKKERKGGSFSKRMTRWRQAATERRRKTTGMEKERDGDGDVDGERSGDGVGEGRERPRAQKKTYQERKRTKILRSKH